MSDREPDVITLFNEKLREIVKDEFENIKKYTSSSYKVGDVKTEGAALIKVNTSGENTYDILFIKHFQTESLTATTLRDPKLRKELAATLGKYLKYINERVRSVKQNNIKFKEYAAQYGAWSYYLRTFAMVSIVLRYYDIVASARDMTRAANAKAQIPTIQILQEALQNIDRQNKELTEAFSVIRTSLGLNESCNLSKLKERISAIHNGIVSFNNDNVNLCEALQNAETVTGKLMEENRNLLERNSALQNERNRFQKAYNDITVLMSQTLQIQIS